MSDRLPKEDQEEFDPSVIRVGGATLLSLAETLPFLASPDTGVPLVMAEDGQSLVNGSESFPLLNGLPLLYPRAAHPYLRPNGLVIPYERYDDPLLQYLLISSIKQTHGFPNTDHANVWYRRHMHRARLLLRRSKGVVLDIGCEDPMTSKLMFPEDVQYIGLDPVSSDPSRFRLIGISEFLPLRDSCMDAICFMTSLDHLLDYHRALDEATRVLKPGGSLYIASLIWSENAELFRDHYHFHHFREYELHGALQRYRIEEEYRYTWKLDAHRFGVYLRAFKPLPSR